MRAFGLGDIFWALHPDTSIPPFSFFLVASDCAMRVVLLVTETPINLFQFTLYCINTPTDLRKHVTP
jgi:hypothetical protein